MADKPVTISLGDYLALVRAGIDPIAVFCAETPRERRMKAVRRWIGVAYVSAMAGAGAVLALLSWPPP